MTNSYGDGAMNEDQRLVYTRGMILQAEIRMNGMVAENKARESLGQALAYGEDAFINLIDEYGICHNALISNLVGQQ